MIEDFLIQHLYRLIKKYEDLKNLEENYFRYHLNYKNQIIERDKSVRHCMRFFEDCIKEKATDQNYE